ncbi:MAG: MFS transporter [Streptosporangiales bacterium]|nr:MFS transporter [Streptosporangiales bacterium]MBO0892116.1 MFS transporter [Acidothermales bacterium]
MTPAAGYGEKLRRSAHGLADVPPSALLVVGGSVLAVAAVGYFRVPLLPGMGADLTMNATALSLVTTLYAVGRLVGDIPAGRLADVLPLPRILSAAAVGSAAGSTLMALAGGRVLAYLGVLVLGLASAAANTSGMTFFSTVARPSRRGTSMALYSAALLGGQAFGPAASGLLSSLTGSWRTALWVGTGVGAVVACTLFVSHRGRRRTTTTTTTATHDAPAAAAAAPRGGARTGERTLLYASSFATFFALGSIPQTLVPLIGADTYHLSAGGIGLALGLGGVFRFVGSLAGGVVSDRISRSYVLAAGLAIMAAGIVLLAPRTSTVLWVVGIVLFSVGSFGVSVGAALLADRMPPSVLGRRLGTYRFAGDLGLMVGPVAGGFLYAEAGQATAVLAVAALLGVCALSCAAFIARDATA